MRGTRTILSATRQGRTIWTRMFCSGPDDRSWVTITETGAAEVSGSPAPRGRGRGSALPDPGNSALQAPGSPGSDEPRAVVKKGVGRGRADLASDATSADSQVVQNPWEGRARENRPKIVPRGQTVRADVFAAYDDLSHVTARDSEREKQRDNYSAPEPTARKIVRKEKEDDDEDTEDSPEVKLKAGDYISRELSAVNYDAMDHFFNMELDPQLRLPKLGRNPEMWDEITTRKPEDILTAELIEHIESAREQYALHQLLKPWYELELHSDEFHDDDEFWDNDQFDVGEDNGQFEDAEEVVEEAVLTDGSTSDGAVSSEAAVTESPSDDGEGEEDHMGEEDHLEMEDGSTPDGAVSSEAAVTESPSDDGEGEEDHLEMEASESIWQETFNVLLAQDELEKELVAATEDGAQKEAEVLEKIARVKEHRQDLLVGSIAAQLSEMEDTMSATEKQAIKGEVEAEAKGTDTEGEDAVSFEKLEQLKEELDKLEASKLLLELEYSDRLPKAVLEADEEFIDELLDQIAEIEADKLDPEQWEELGQAACEDLEILELARVEKEKARGGSGLKHVKEEGAAIAAMAEEIDIPKADPLAEMVRRAAHTMQGNRSMSYKQKADAMDEILDSLDIPKKEKVSS